LAAADQGELELVYFDEAGFSVNSVLGYARTRLSE
jgi:hypothetical protein